MLGTDPPVRNFYPQIVISQGAENFEIFLQSSELALELGFFHFDRKTY
jgi:hypothetical protein